GHGSRRALEWLAERRRSLRGRWLSAVLAVATMLLWSACFVFAAPGVFEELEAASLWPFAVTLASALGGTLWLTGAPRKVLGSLGLAGLVLALGGAWRPLSDPLRIAIDQRTAATKRLLQQREMRVQATAQVDETNQPAGTCWADTPAKPFAGVGRVDSKAPDIVLLTVDALR